MLYPWHLHAFLQPKLHLCAQAIKPVESGVIGGTAFSLSFDRGNLVVKVSKNSLTLIFLLQKQQSCPKLAQLALHCHFSLKQPRLKERIWKTEKLIWRCGFIAINFAGQNQHALIIMSYKNVRDTHLLPPQLRVGPRRSSPLPFITLARYWVLRMLTRAYWIQVVPQIS